MSESAKEPIKIYLDDQDEPFQVAEPPLRFYFSTIHLADGEHTLRVEASNGLAPPTVRKIPFHVRNGVAVTVSGLEPNQTIGGQVELIINAYAGNTEVDFEPRQAETPQPIPTWAWVLLLAVGAWTLFYVINPRLASRVAAAVSAQAPAGGGERIYVDTCARCHGEDGRGQRDADDPQTLRVAELRNTKNLAVAENPDPESAKPSELFIHSTKLVLVDQAGRVRGYFDGEDEEVVLNQLLPAILRLEQELPDSPPGVPVAP